MSNNSFSQPSNVQWAVIHLTYNLAEAQVIAGLLEAEGVPVMIYQEAGARAFGITVGRLAEIRVLVRPADYERALAILEPDTPNELSDSTDTISYHFADEEEDDE